MKKLLLVLSGLLMLQECGPAHTQHKKTVHKQSVRRYTTHEDAGDLLYWYVIMSCCNSSCYYYCSATPVTDFSAIRFTAADAAPVNMQLAEELPVQEINQDQLSPETQTEFNTNAEDFGGMTVDEMGDYEGSTDNATESTPGDAGDAGDAGGSSGDGGGGDGGGGD